MRHADIRTTMNVYGTAGTAEMREAHGKDRSDLPWRGLN